MSLPNHAPLCFRSADGTPQQAVRHAHWLADEHIQSAWAEDVEVGEYADRTGAKGHEGFADQDLGALDVRN